MKTEKISIKDKLPRLGTVEPSESQEETQDEQWMDVCVETHAIEKIGVSAVIMKLKEKFTITRK